MSFMRKRLRSELPNSQETSGLLTKIAGLFAQQAKHVVFEVGDTRFSAADCTNVSFAPNAAQDNVNFQRPGGGSIEHYESADIQIIRRLRVKKWLIRIKGGSPSA